MSRLRASYVQTGGEVTYACPDCSGHRMDVTVYALTDTGPVSIGTLVSCEHCGMSFRCRFCIAVIASDGGVIYQHMAGHPDA